MLKRVVIGAVIAVAVAYCAREVFKRGRIVCARCGCTPARCGCDASMQTDDREEAVAATG